jgi:hypothetical protein
MSIITRVKRIGRSGLVLIPLAAATGLHGCAFARHNDPASSSPSSTGRSIAAAIIGAAMGGGAANDEHAKNMLSALSAADRDLHNAEQSGDSDAQMRAGMKMIGTLVRGGRPHVTPIPHDVLKTLLPETVSGLTRSSISSSSGSLSGIGTSSAQAVYGQTGSSTLDVTVADLANMSGLAAAANLTTTMNVESDEDGGYEKNVDVDGHRVHEKWTSDGKRSDLTEIVDNRYVVSIEGSGVAMDSAVEALRSIDVTIFQALGAAPRARDRR